MPWVESFRLFVYKENGQVKKNLLAGLATGLVMFGMVGVASADYYSMTLSDFSITTRSFGTLAAPTISSLNGYTSAHVAFNYDSKSGLPLENVLVSTNQGSASYNNGTLNATATPTNGNLYSDSGSYAGGNFIVNGKGFVDIMANYIYSTPSSNNTSQGNIWAQLGISDSKTNHYGSDYFYADNYYLQSESNGSGTMYVSFLTNSGSNTLNLSASTGASAYPTTPAPTPIPGAVLLFGSGLAGLVGLRRNKKD